MQTKLLNKLILAVFPAVILAVLWIFLDMAQERVLAGDYGLTIYNDTLLDRDITGSVIIAVNNIVLDCGGHTITGSGTSEDPSPTWGIHLYQKEGVVITNCNITNFTTGIGVSYSSNITLSGNSLFGNKYGIALHRSTTNTLIDNKLTENLIGIDLRQDSCRNTLNNNEVALNESDGVLLRSYSSRNIISANKILNNKGNGINLFWQGYGANQIVNNRIDSNSDHGIYFYFARGNVITENTISNNQYDVSFLSQSWNNVFYHNNFINNGKSAERERWEHSNIYDNGYPSGGNYWSDYQGGDNFSGPYQDQPGEDGIGDYPYYPYNVPPQPDWYNYISGRDRYPFMRENGWKTQPDFSVEAIRPVQVVWEPDINNDGRIDLVAGKATMVRVEIGMEDYEVLDKDTQIEINLSLPDPSGEHMVLKIFQPTIEELLSMGKQLDVEIDFDLPLGDHIITAEIDPMNKIKESDLFNNYDYIDITVKDTNGLYIIYFPVLDGKRNKIAPNLGSYEKTVLQSEEFILVTYPISAQEFKNENGKEYFYSTTDLTTNGGRVWELAWLWLKGQRASNGQNDISVGIVPHGSLGVDMKGIAPAKFLKFGAVFVEEDYWTVTAHEVGHVYGLWRWQEEYERYPNNPYGKPVEGGFWVTKQHEMLHDKAFCFMSYIWPGGNAESTWDFWISLDKENNLLMPLPWICKECYENLFKEFRVNQTDPETLSIGGVISKDGSIQFLPSYISSNGMLDEGESGNYSAKVLNINNDTIYELPFDVRFQIHTTPGGIVDTDITPFALSLPYTPEIFRIEIKRGEEVIAELEPKSKLLRDAIDLIPDYGFVKNPEQHRNALHDKVNVVENMLRQRNTNGAVQKLEYDIKDKLEKWLFDEYQKEDLLQYSKKEILDLVNKIIQTQKTRDEESTK